jgi:hypothetical protein
MLIDSNKCRLLHRWSLGFITPRSQVFDNDYKDLLPILDYGICIVRYAAIFNESANESAKQTGRLLDGRNYMILKVGTAGFEPTASCTPTKINPTW